MNLIGITHTHTHIYMHEYIIISSDYSIKKINTIFISN